MKIIETDWQWQSGLIPRSYTQYIVLHHAASVRCSAADVDRWHKNNGWSGIGYHYFVRKDGSIYRGRPEWAMGAQVSGKNNISLGVCAEGDYSKETKMPEPQRAAIIGLVRELLTRYPAAAVVGHRDIGVSGCPGIYYPAELFDENTYKKGDGLTMTQYEELKKDIDTIRAELSQRIGFFNYIDGNMDESYRPTIQKLVDKKLLTGNENGELMLTTDMMRIFTVLDRAGIFG